MPIDHSVNEKADRKFFAKRLFLKDGEKNADTYHYWSACGLCMYYKSVLSNCLINYKLFAFLDIYALL